ncbi:MAG: transglycosylase domain-containing protein [Bacteroidia bacterium]
MLLAIPLAICMVWELFYLSVKWEFWGPIPTAQSLSKVENPTSSEIYSIDQELLGKYFIENRTNVSYQALSPHIVNALLATEDIRFWEHDGVDRPSLGRVAIKTLLLQKQSAGGGSTLTQQLAKNLYPRESFGLMSLPINKVREMVIARKIEGILTKEEILAFYLNTVSFGDNAFGIEAACHRYFNTTASEIKAEDAAVLVAMLKAPTTYNPRNHQERATKRRDLVLHQLEKYHFAPKRTIDSLCAIPLQLDYSYTTHNHGLAPYFRERLRQELVVWCKTVRKADGTFYNLYTDGLKIHTTLHAGMQRYAEAAMANYMPRLQKAFDRQWPRRLKRQENRALIKAQLRQTPLYKKAVADSLPQKQIDSLMRVPRPMTVFSWAASDQDTVREFSVLDSLYYYNFLLHSGLMAMEPSTGHVRTWVGGINHQWFQYDHVNSHRQAGSIFKPIVYAAALEKGVPPCEYFSNEQTTYEAYDDWTPRNSDNQYGGEYSMQGALTYSVNVASVNIILETGPKKVVELAHKLGMQAELPPYPSLALGSGDVSIFEILQAYSTFVNQGKHIYPQYLLRIEDAEGNVLLDNSGNVQSEQVLKVENAQMITKMLQSVTDHGTATSLRTRYRLGNNFIGKTGTSQSQADGWFVGGNPDLIAGCWVGADNPQIHFRSLAQGQGAATALPIFARFFQKVIADPEFEHYKNLTFSKASNEIVQAMDCDEFWFPYSMSAFKEWWAQQEAEKQADSLLNQSIEGRVNQ